MKQTLILSFILILGIGCKISQITPNDANKKDGIGDLQKEEDRAFTNSEMRIIREICNNMTSKRVYFDAMADSKVNFYFKLENKDCSEKTTIVDKFETTLTKNSSGDFIFSASRSDYLPNVTTDLSPGYRYLCSNMNATNINNYFIESNVKYSYKISIYQGYDRIELFKITNSSNGPVVKYGERIDFLTLTSQGPNSLLGHEYERTRSLPCENGKASTTKQTWLNI